MALRDLTLSDKLWIGTFVVLLAALFLGSAGAQRRTSGAVADAARLAQDHDALSQLARRAKSNLLVQLNQLQTGGLPAEAQQTRAFAAQVRAGLADPQRLQQGVDLVGGGRVQDVALSRIGEARATVHAALRRIDERTIVGDRATLQQLALDELLPAMRGYAVALDRFTTLQDDRRDAARTLAHRTRGNTVWIALSALAFVSAAGGVAMMTMMRKIRRAGRGAAASALAASAAASPVAGEGVDEQASDHHLGWAFSSPAGLPAGASPDVR